MNRTASTAVEAGEPAADQNESGKRTIRDLIGIAPDGRKIHYWRGRDRGADIAALADAVVAAIPELVNQDNALVRLEGTRLAYINLAGLGELIGQHICGMRVVNHGSADKPDWQREYFSYRFEASPRRVSTWETGLPTEADRRTTGPDYDVLKDLYLKELVWRVPRVG